MKSIRVMTALLISLTAAGSSNSARCADTWTGWLDPDRDGWVADFKPPAAWPESLNRVWSVQVWTGYIEVLPNRETRPANEDETTPGNLNQRTN